MHRFLRGYKIKSFPGSLLKGGICSRTGLEILNTVY